MHNRKAELVHTQFTIALGEHLEMVSNLKSTSNKQLITREDIREQLKQSINVNQNNFHIWTGKGNGGKSSFLNRMASSVQRGQTQEGRSGIRGPLNYEYLSAYGFNPDGTYNPNYRQERMNFNNNDSLPLSDENLQNENVLEVDNFSEDEMPELEDEDERRLPSWNDFNREEILVQSWGENDWDENVRWADIPPPNSDGMDLPELA